MTYNVKRRIRTVAAVAALGVFVQPSAPSIGPQQVSAQTVTKPATPSTQTSSTQSVPAARAPTAATTSPADGGWPRVYNLSSGGTIVVSQPQVASWDQQTHLVAFSAVTYQSSAADAKPAFGTIKLEAETKVSVPERLVNFKSLKIAEAHFQTLQKEQVREIVAEIDDAIPDDERVIALDRVLANLDKSAIVPRNAEGIKADPPTIFFSKTPAVIVNLDGEPIWSPIKGNDLQFAVNTNWDLFQHSPTGTYYLRHNNTWLKAVDVKGPWSAAGTLPDSFRRLPDEDNWKDVKANLPGTLIAASAVPKVFVSFRPAETIVLNGEPAYVPVTGTNLMWVSNTESDIFRMGKTGSVYYLVAGRWFSAPDFTGPWTFATLTLPADFKKIPLGHERSRVLASVPGTDEAAEAVLLAQIPQTARVNKKELKAPAVDFQGAPQFAPIEQTTVQRAVNTDKDVFKVGDRYYMCYQGVWFVGGSASGPWEVAESVPQQIYQIPSSSPAHHVTYVTVEEDDDYDDDWVEFAAAAGYLGTMVAWGVPVWGTGWYYPPYYGWAGYSPFYYGHFPTYGYSSWYNPWTGGYGRSAGIYGPYGGAGVGARYNPRTGTYSRGAAAYGPYGGRGVAQAYNPRTGTYAATRQGANVYGRWGSTAVQRGDDWARTSRYTNRQTGATTRTFRTDQGSAVTRRGAGGGTVAAGSGGNVYAGRDGSVYRNQNGTWQKYDNGSWSNTARQSAQRAQQLDRSTLSQRSGTFDRSTLDRSTVNQLNRDYTARRDGAQRTRDFGSYRGGSGMRGTGSFRGGGGMRGGGGFRGGGGRR
jgi:hypothetical protein